MPREEELALALRTMADPFLRSEPCVYVALCCDRLFVGVAPAAKCSTCASEPANYELRTLEAVESIAKQIADR